MNETFLRLLDLMTSPLLMQDGFAWYIRSIDMLPEGPCAIFQYDWRRTPPGAVPTSSHDSFSCMSLRMEHEKPVLHGETCSMGPQGRDATQALQNRFNKALHVVLP